MRTIAGSQDSLQIALAAPGRKLRPLKGSAAASQERGTSSRKEEKDVVETRYRGSGKEESVVGTRCRSSSKEERREATGDNDERPLASAGSLHPEAA